IVGENPVRAVVVNHVVADYVFAGTKGRPSGIDGQFDSSQARLVAVIFLHDVRTRTGEADAIAFTPPRRVRIGIRHVARNYGIVGFVEIDDRAVIIHLVSGDSNICDDQPVGVYHGSATFPSRSSYQENSVEPVVVNFTVGDAAGVDGEFRIAVIQLNSRAFIVVYEQGIE